MEHINHNQRFYQDGDTITIIEVPPMENVFKNIPKGVYKYIPVETPHGIKHTLKFLPDFILPPKIYGDTNERCDRIINTYLNKSYNIGVCLYGQSGGGKTLLAKLVSSKLSNIAKMPVISIDKDGIKYISSYLDKLYQPCIILIDEFEKLFLRKEEQSFLLTILDGVYQTRHLFLLTGNDKSMILPYFFNRPSRLRYVWEYSGLTREVISEILNDNIKDELKKAKILDIMYRTKDLSFDTLYTFIDECNLYPDKEPIELFKGFNALENNRYLRHDYELEVLTKENKMFSLEIPNLVNLLSGISATISSNVYRSKVTLSGLLNYREGVRISLGEIELQIQSGQYINRHRPELEVIDVKDVATDEDKISFSAKLTNSTALTIYNILKNVIENRIREDKLNVPDSDIEDYNKLIMSFLEDELLFNFHKLNTDMGRALSSINRREQEELDIPF